MIVSKSESNSVHQNGIANENDVSSLQNGDIDPNGQCNGNGNQANGSVYDSSNDVQMIDCDNSDNNNNDPKCSYTKRYGKFHILAENKDTNGHIDDPSQIESSSNDTKSKVESTSASNEVDEEDYSHTNRRRSSRLKTKELNESKNERHDDQSSSIQKATVSNDNSEPTQSILKEHKKHKHKKEKKSKSSKHSKKGKKGNNEGTTSNDLTMPSQDSSLNSQLESDLSVLSINNNKRDANDIIATLSHDNNEPLPPFEALDQNLFLFERKKSRVKKEAKKMICDCILTKEEIARGQVGCGEDCLNRMLMIECGSKCWLEDKCSNKRFAKRHYAKVEPFKTAKKGWGLRTLENLSAGAFILEYVGEVLDAFEFHNRVEKYAKQKLEHHYFMALKSDEIIDATKKGNVTRFINHSCDPNSETQKWTVNGELRIGFFTIKPLAAGEEITFDYQFQRYGKKAQKCYCESENCRGYIGSEEATLLTDGSKIQKNATNETPLDKKEEEFLEDTALEEEIDQLAEQGGLRNRKQILLLSRLMLRIDKTELRLKLLGIIMSTFEMAYLRLFLDYHGLKILWSWMVEAEDTTLKARLLELLKILPIGNKTMLISSKVWDIVQRWSNNDSEFVVDPNEKLNDDHQSNDISSHTVNDDVNRAESHEESAPTTEFETNDSKVEEKNISTNNNSGVEGEDESKLVYGKFIKKIKSKSNSEIIQAPRKSKISIGEMARSLLAHWKDLKEVFRIPRLEREKRHEDEMVADMKTIEEENKRQNESLQGKRFLDDRNDSFTDDNRKRFRPFNSDFGNKNFNHSNVSNEQSTVNRAHNRKMFEFTMAQKDYEEALNKYHENLANYSIAFRTQFETLRNAISQSSMLNVFQFSDSQKVEANQLVPPNFLGYVDSGVQHTEAYYTNGIAEDNTAPEEEIEPEEIDMSTLKPKYCSPLVYLANNQSQDEDINSDLSTYAIDNVDFTQVKYESDDFFESMEKKMMDEIYPPVGTFYITPKETTYFFSYSDEVETTLTVNLKENVTEPLSIDFTKKLTDNPLPYSWKHSIVHDHIYYFNKYKNIKQWHPPTDSQIDCYDEIPSSSSSPKPSADKEFDDIVFDEVTGVKRKNPRKIHETFRNKVSQFIVKCLNPYMRKECKQARITNDEDFKYLARKLSHSVIGKELKACKHIEDLTFNESVMKKSKEYVRRYMRQFADRYDRNKSSE